MKMSSQRVSGPFTGRDSTQGCGLESGRVIERGRRAIATP
jgi:hypothetical protein